LKRSIGYNEVIKIEESINKKIINKVKESEFNEEIKEFLEKILFLEFQHSEEYGWRYSKEYEKHIKKYADRYEVK